MASFDSRVSAACTCVPSAGGPVCLGRGSHVTPDPSGCVLPEYTATLTGAGTGLTLVEAGSGSLLVCFCRLKAVLSRLNAPWDIPRPPLVYPVRLLGLDRDMTEEGSESSELMEASANESVLWAKWSQMPSTVFLTAMTPIAPIEWLASTD